MKNSLILIALAVLTAGPAQAEQEALMAHIQRCWMAPSDAETPSVRLYVTLDVEGAVEAVETRAAPKSEEGERALVSARRAIHLCAPYGQFTGADGEDLREFEVTFTPGDG